MCCIYVVLRISLTPHYTYFCIVILLYKNIYGILLVLKVNIFSCVYDYLIFFYCVLFKINSFHNINHFVIFSPVRRVYTGYWVYRIDTDGPVHII